MKIFSYLKWLRTYGTDIDNRFLSLLSFTYQTIKMKKQVSAFLIERNIEF